MENRFRLRFLRKFQYLARRFRVYSGFRGFRYIARSLRLSACSPIDVAASFRHIPPSPVGPWVCLCVFWVAWFIFMSMCVLFYLGQLSHFVSCFGAGVTNLNEPPSSFLLPPHYCGLGAGSIPFRAIVNNEKCDVRGLFMSLVIHYWIGDVQDSQGVSASEMTYTLCRVGR